MNKEWHRKRDDEMRMTSKNKDDGGDGEKQGKNIHKKTKQNKTN